MLKLKYLTRNATVFPVPVLALARTSLPGGKIDNRKLKLQALKKKGKKG